MTRTRTVVTVLVAAALLVGTAAPAAAGALPGTDSTQSVTGTVDDTGAQENNTTQNGSVDVAVGQQLSTVVSVTSDEVETEVEDTAFEVSFERANESERAEAVAQRVAELRERAGQIRADYRDATAAYESGNLTKSAYGQRLATLNARADSVLHSLSAVRERATNVSELELRAEGVANSTLENATEPLSAVAGAGPSALLQRYLGASEGEVELETADGLSIEAESESGERSRELQRPQDDNNSITVTQSAALETARGALSTPENGSWRLRSASVHDDDGYYNFEFALAGTNSTGEAEVRVDGSSGDVFRLEAAVEASERDNDEDDRETDEREGDELALVVAGGTPAANETITVRALSNGDPAANATVALNGDVVGTTAADGTLSVTLPASGEAELTATRGDSEGELGFEFGDEDDEVYRALAVDASVGDNTTTVSVTYDGDSVAGASVYANGERVGQTGSDGTVTFRTPGGDELELEVVKGEFEAELSYELRDGTLVQTEGPHEGDGDKADGERENESGEDEGDEEAADDEAENETEDGSDEPEETEAEGTETEDEESGDATDSDDETETEATETEDGDGGDDTETEATETEDGDDD
ncbi:DUF7096 domain-containing protein [Halobacterium noricense]|uniref:DUF7096 domain-containing protein n=1 Tax=Halobacterium noricense TaxID=223182 RepID=UPI001E294B1E|nr:hypothetical protein [Halobacterium noricense]UHH24622.1 hypothetical protein LT974_11585 [Halobacterium noricense]